MLFQSGRLLCLPRVSRSATILLLLSATASLPAQDTAETSSASASAVSRAASGVGSSTTSAADEPSAPTVSVNVKVVNLLATVRDKHDKILPDLNQNDFTLEEDSHPVTIQYFSKESNLPLTLGLMVDTSLSQRNLLDQEKSASKTFFDQVLGDKDAAFLIHFDREVELLQDLTSSHPKLDSAIAALETRSLRDEDNSSRTNGPDSNPDDNPQGPGRSRGMHRGGTTLYDAIYLASDELMKKQQGRKAVVIL